MAAYKPVRFTLAFSRHPHLFSSSLLVIFIVFVIARLPPAVSGRNLTCYSCNTTRESDVCYRNVSEASTQVCEPNVASMTCSVYREDVAGKFTYMIRGCNTSCIQKCGAWGEVVDIDKCSSCCSTDLCNVDDAASTPWTLATTCLHCAVVALGVLFASCCGGAVAGMGD